LLPVKVAVTGAEANPAWVEASFTEYWQEPLISTSIQNGQPLIAPFPSVAVDTVVATPPLYDTQYNVPALVLPLL